MIEKPAPLREKTSCFGLENEYSIKGYKKFILPKFIFTFNDQSLTDSVIGNFSFPKKRYFHPSLRSKHYSAWLSDFFSDDLLVAIK